MNYVKNKFFSNGDKEETPGVATLWKELEILIMGLNFIYNT